MKKTIKGAKLAALLVLCGLLGGCDDVAVYGSVGVSSFNGCCGSSFGTSVSVGGRIF